MFTYLARPGSRARDNAIVYLAAWTVPGVLPLVVFSHRHPLVSLVVGVVFASHGAVLALLTLVGDGFGECEGGGGEEGEE